ncbi:uncharacterized protein LOC143294215 [Babylonia areolata]|uniref:uncharacterized protein LOC143294215 n=1 Tax=Babylonia areolata TaxID=304850 RepID=UPI003FCFC08E
MNIGDVSEELQSQTSQAEVSSNNGTADSSAGAGAGPGGSGGSGCAGCSRSPDATRRIFTDRTVDMLNDLRERGQLCDGLVRAGQTSFLVHRNILSATSGFFRAVFTTGGLVMPTLTKECCKYLKRQLCAENSLGIAAFARAYFRTGLMKTAMRFANSNFGAVVSGSQEFLELSEDSLYEYLSSDELNVRHEELVFEAICKWIQFQPEVRKPAMPRMLTAVRLGHLSTEYLMERIKIHEYVCNNEEAKQIVIEALKHVCKLKTNDGPGHSLIHFTKPRMPYEILFVIGGWSGGSPTNIVETYDARADQWLVCRAPDLEPRAYHACVSVGQVIYVVGGFNGVEYFNSCRRFYPKHLRWTEAPPMNSKRCYVSAVGLHGRVYAMGGFDGHVRLNSVERLDPRTNQWSHIMPMVQQRSDAKASVLNDKIYICGGFNGQECLNTAEYYDPTANQWTMITPMRNRRSGVGVVAYHGCIYALGGFNGITRMNTAERYDPSTETWATLPEMYSPRSNFAAGVVDDLLFAIGGFNGVTTISHVECYDEVSNEWFDTEGLSLFRSALSACVVKDLPNIHDFIYKPKTPCKRKRSHPNSPAATPTTSPEGSPPPQPPLVPPAPPPDVLNQLA